MRMLNALMLDRVYVLFHLVIRISIPYARLTYQVLLGLESIELTT